ASNGSRAGSGHEPQDRRRGRSQSGAAASARGVSTEQTETQNQFTDCHGCPQCHQWKAPPGRRGGFVATIPGGGHPERDVIKPLLLFLLRVYRAILSPLRMILPAPAPGGCCRFHPTCSC